MWTNAQVVDGPSQDELEATEWHWVYDWIIDSDEYGLNGKVRAVEVRDTHLTVHVTGFVPDGIVGLSDDERPATLVLEGGQIASSFDNRRATSFLWRLRDQRRSAIIEWRRQDDSIRIRDYDLCLEYKGGRWSWVT